ncbi:MAG: AI-2E family transporter [Sphingomonadales bacterium]|nr:AI-2E family transporter [Sphingomonadales bacterium]
MGVRDYRNLRIEDGGFLVLVLLVTLAFVWLCLPFFGAILWGVVVAIVFAPVYRGLVLQTRGHRNTAAGLTLLLILALVILPAVFIAVSLAQEAAALYAQYQAGEIDPAAIVADLRGVLPHWALRLLDRWGLGNWAAAQRTLGTTIAAGLQDIAARALVVGQGALSFVASLGVMLYLTYFLLRDGETMGAKIKAAVPLRPDLRDALIDHFVVVVRATMKGTVVVAILQGLVGGVIFWLLGVEGALLWGLLMGFFSLVPAVGTAIVWLPVSVYLMASGSLWQGIVLAGCGVFVIGMIDNLLRPILVGKDTRMPDFLVLIATLAGIELFGLNGFIVGPVIAALFVAVWNIIAEQRGVDNALAAD